MVKYKKSMIMNISLVIITLFILSTSFINLLSQSSRVLDSPLSYRSADILISAQKGESLRFYLFQYFKRNIESQIEGTIAFNGQSGISTLLSHPCGETNSVNYWSNESNNCYPNILFNLENGVNSKTDSLIRNHPFFETSVSRNYYSLSIFNSSTLLFLSNDPFPIQNEGGIYYARPSFKVQTNLNLTRLFKAPAYAMDLKNTCGSSTDIPDCVNQFINTNRLSWTQISQTPPPSNSFIFEVPISILSTTTSHELKFALFI